jgi:YesN/AraC family two-component response regulator
VDLETPDVDAVHILKSVTETSPGTHRVVISANDDDRVVQSLFKAGAEAYLLKPVREVELRNVLQKLGPPR